MSAFASNLIEFVMKPTLVLLAVFALHFILRRASAATRHLALALALVGLALLPFLSLALPAWDLAILPGDGTPAPAGPTARFAPLELPDELGSQAAMASAVTAPVETTSAGVASAAPTSFAAWFFPVWILGMAYVLARFAAGLARMRWIVQRGERLDDPGHVALLEECRQALGLRTRPRMIRSEHVGVPVVWGWMRPTLIFPRQSVVWTPERNRAVMLHELAHLKRVDWPVLLLGRIVASLYWFHPLVWVLERSAKRECEQACDDLVVRCGTRPSEYADHLLSIARGRQNGSESALAALAVVRHSQLENRLRSILNPVLRRGAPSRRAIAIVSGAFLVALLPFASMQLAERAYADEPTADEPTPHEPVPDESASGHGFGHGLWHGHDADDDPDHSYKVGVTKQNGDLIDGDSAGARLYEKAYEMHHSGSYDEATAAFEEAAALAYRPATSKYNAACGYALMGDSSLAIRMLTEAQAAGWDDVRHIVEDSDFDPIRSEATFQRYVDESFEAAGHVRGEDDYPYRNTVAHFREMNEAESTNGKEWYHVGTKLLGFRELDMGIEALNEAVLHMGEWSQNGMYNLACAYSLAGRTKPALQWLDRAVQAGFDQHERFINDSDLNNLRDSREFERIMAESELLSLGSFPKRSWEHSNYSEARWAPAIERYQAYVATYADSGRGYFNLGWALHHSKRFDEAIAAWDKAAQLGHRPSTTAYNLACANAKLGRTTTALDYLDQALELGVGYGQLKGDDDLESLRGEPRFQTMLLEAEARHKKQTRHKKETKEMKRHQLR